MSHFEHHHIERVGWLRAAVLGANDGLISTSSLVVGIAAAQSASGSILLAAAAGTIAGALSMAAGEYVSVSTQADTERADLARERRELAAAPELELEELTGIYVGRGLAPKLAAEVARQLTAHNALLAHARDELGLSHVHRARPLQAALASAASFAAGALAPVAIVLLVPAAGLIPAVMFGTLGLLALLGAIAARLGGANLSRGAVRVALWGAIAMSGTALLGRLLGTAML